MPPASPAPSAGRADLESRDWVDALASADGRRDAAIGDLHELMLKVARAEAARRTGWHGIRGPGSRGAPAAFPSVRCS